MNNAPTVSVILSTYSEPVAFVTQAVESILNQTSDFQEFIIVVDDCQNLPVVDYLHTVARSDARVQLIVHTLPEGLPACRNQGIMAATGEYIMLMDADDVSTPNRLASQYKWLVKKNADVVFSHTTLIDELGKKVDAFTPFTNNPKRDVYLRHTFVHPTAFMKRNVVLEKLYDVSLHRAQDVDLWIRLLDKDCVFTIVPESLLLYRIHRSSSVLDRLKRQAGYSKYGFKIVKKHFMKHSLNPFFWYFTIKWSFFNILLNYTPRIILIGLVHIKDTFRK